MDAQVNLRAIAKGFGDEVVDGSLEAWMEDGDEGEANLEKVAGLLFGRITALMNDVQDKNVFDASQLMKELGPVVFAASVYASTPLDLASLKALAQERKKEEETPGFKEEAEALFILD